MRRASSSRRGSPAGSRGRRSRREPQRRSPYSPAMALLTMRFDLRIPDFATTTHREAYAAALEMAEWADGHGFTTVVLSEHHGVDDGYVPAPLPLAGAVLGRTRNVAVTIAALLVPLYDPLRLAEDIAVLDLVGGGRLAIVAGLGYR